MNFFYRVFFLLNISILFFTFTYVGAEHMFTKYDLVLIFLIFIFILSIELTILFLFNKKKFKIYILSFFCTINIISLHLVFIEYIHLLPMYLELIVFLIFLLLIIFVCKVLEDSIIMSKILVISPIFFVFITFTLNSEIFSINNDFQKQNIDIGNNQKIYFHDKPNVYFISFESMVPQSIAKKNFKSDKFEYHDILNENFYNFKNTFTLAFPSRESLNSLLAFDQKKYLSLKKENKHYDFFTGIQQSPFLKIFKDNNYDLTTFYDNFWFGRNKGNYIDNYQVNQSGGKFNTCAFDEGYGFHVKVSFLGYCLLPENIKFNFLSFILNKKLKKTTTIEKILEIMDLNIKKNKPQFLMAHNINPGHTDNYKFGRQDDFENFKKIYYNKSKIVKGEIEKILHFIEEKDSNAILLIYSDHGPKLSAGLEFEEDPYFKITDSFAVFAGIYPKERCKKYANFFYQNRQFASLIDVSKIIVNCLNKDENTMNFNDKQFFMDMWGENKYFSNEDNIVSGYNNLNLRLENYLYE